MKNKILKDIEDLKKSRSKIIKGKHASPQEIIKLLKNLDVQVDRLQIKLKELK